MLNYLINSIINIINNKIFNQFNNKIIKLILFNNKNN